MADLNFPLFSDYERGFLSAAIDGEGSLFIYKDKYKNSKRGYIWRLGVTFTNKNKDWLECIKKICRSDTKIVPTGNNVYVFRLRKSEIEDILSQISLVIKEEQRVLLLEACRYFKGSGYALSDEDHRMLELIYKDIKMLNRKTGRGKDDTFNG